MGRKRLLTILATVAAAVTLQAGPASAQLDDTVDLGSDDDCLEVGVDISLEEALKLDPSVCVSEDGVEVEGGSETLGQEVDAGETTDKVEETTEKVTDTAKQEAPAPAPPKEPAPNPGGSGSGDDGGSSSDGGSTAPSGGDGGSDVAASGEVREPEAPAVDEARQRHLGTLLAIRDDLAAGSSVDRGIAGPVRPFGDLLSTDDLAAPQVADAAGVTPDVDSPAVAPADEADEKAVFASTTPMGDLAEAPIALQLLAAALVLGAAAVWTLAAREFGVKDQTTSA